jgi:acetolactate synthase-1/2/3 large subunit
VLKSLNAEMEPQNHGAWLYRIEEWQRECPPLQIRETASLLPQYVMNQIYEVTKGDAIIVTGVGQNQMWAALYYKYDRPKNFISSGGLGPMGFELPAAMGAQVGRPGDTVWCIAGDGGFQMTLQELATIVQEHLPVKIAILNNGFLGMVRQWQELFYGKRYVATPLSGPDFVKLAGAYGIAAERVTDRMLVTGAIENAMAHAGPYLIDFQIEPEENVLPIVKKGETISEMILEKPREGVKAK